VSEIKIYALTEHACDVGNSGKTMRQKASHAHENITCRGGAFYPELANVGKQIFKEHAWLGYAVAHRFVQCWGLKRSRNANNGAGAVFQHETFCGLLSSRAEDALHARGLTMLG